MATTSPPTRAGLAPRPRWRLASALALAGVALAGLAFVLIAGQPAAAGAGDAVSARDEHLQLLVFDQGEWWNVAIQLLVYDDGTGNYAATAAAARDDALARFPGAIEVRPGEASAQYAPAPYWWPAHTVAWGYNPAGKPASLVNEVPAMQAAAATWNGAGALWSFPAGDPTTAATGACSQAGRDRRNTVGWARQPVDTLAETCTWYPRSGGDPLPASEFDMEIDPDWSWTTGSPVRTDLQSVVAHEFGHALGLAHPPERQCPGPLMCARYRAGALVRTLQADDIAGLVAIYGAAPTPEPTPVPTPTVGPYHNVAPALSRDQ